MRLHKFWGALGPALIVLVAATAMVAVPSAQAQTYSVLYSFGMAGGAGVYPLAGLIQDRKGNLYGTASEGGFCHLCGTVFKVRADGKVKVLYRFTRDGLNGELPMAGVVRDSAGNLYGTTDEGGNVNGTCRIGCGTVYKVDATGTETVLHTFGGGADGFYPYAGLVRDSAGNLYGTTNSGGAFGAGTVFKVDATGGETVLYSFDGTDGSSPYAGLVRDSAGNLYGTTSGGGGLSSCGVVFELEANGDYKVLYSFTCGADGGAPHAGVVRDSNGNLYGTTVSFGAYGAGTVFKLDRSGAFSVLYSFTGGADGAEPVGGVIRDSGGNLYGTTLSGGNFNDCPVGCGTVFELETNGNYSVLYSFTARADTYAGLLRDSAGNLYGTSRRGGTYDRGVVFKVAPQ
jgi:uncharacterized repeat protein (TIGR03803 family)